MQTSLKITTSIQNANLQFVLADSSSKFDDLALSKTELAHLKKRIKAEEKWTEFGTIESKLVVALIEKTEDLNWDIEQVRKVGNRACGQANHEKATSISVTNKSQLENAALAFAEGTMLGNYEFRKYKTGKDAGNSLKSVLIEKSSTTKTAIAKLQATVDGTLTARDLINEPLSYLTAPQLSKEIRALGKKCGFRVEVMNKAKIASMKMGGLLSVNRGSVDPPTFNIMEWKPAKSRNKKPLVLVGKGVVYDTGGLSLKPTQSSMDFMKSDMSGAAAVIGAMCAVSSLKLPVHVIGLIPATDNRPGVDAYVPGDVITISNGKTVEVLNTDAEGRLILADALSYAQKLKPELVIDLATLTGAAARGVGKEAMVSFFKTDTETARQLKASGQRVYERMIEMPLWKEYGDYIQSDIADIKNVGGPTAGAITAAKFLEHFTGQLSIII